MGHRSLPTIPPRGLILRSLASRLRRWLILLALPAAAAPLGAQSSPVGIPRDTLAARLRDLMRIHTPEGIEVVEELEVNGTRQWVSIRGLDQENPVLFVLHGGPGSPLMGMTWAYQKPWEDFFTVVNWDQRGVGKSFSAADSARLGPTMSLEQLADDAAVVVQHIRRRLGPNRIILLGHSYGTAIGPLLIRNHPDWFAAWVPVGQMSPGANEQELFRSLLQRVRERDDTVALRALEAMAPYPPTDRSPTLPELLEVRRWARSFDGGWFGKPTLDLYFALPFLGPDYTAEEAEHVGAATAWASRHLMGSDRHRPALPPVEEFDVPVIMLHGRFDLMTPYSGARAWFDRIRAPMKQLVTFERSAHFIMFEEPGRFLMTLVNVVRPLAQGAGPAAGLAP